MENHLTQAKSAEFIELVRRLSQKTGALCEFFLEEREENQMSLSKGQISPLTRRKETGASLRLIKNAKETFGYTNDLSAAGIHTLEETILSLYLLEGAPTGAAGSSVKLMHLSANAENVIPAIVLPSMVDGPYRARLLRRAEEEMTDIFSGKQDEQEDKLPLTFFLRKGTAVKNLSYQLSDETRKILIINSDGVCAGDERVYTRLRVYYTLENSRLGLSSSEWCEAAKIRGYEAFEEDAFIARIRGRILESAVMLTAEPMIKGAFPVVFANSTGGTLFHECCGHQLEASAIAAKSSDFCGRLGETVASPKVSLYDEGCLQSAYGSGNIDDEGVETRRNLLIREGKLKTYLIDRVHGEAIGMPSNGSGRRQNYTFSPTSRMSNTFVAPGTDEEKEIVSSVPAGLYVTSLGGGSGGSIFSILATGGFLIENGAISRPIKRVMLSDRGMDLMMKIDRVGQWLRIEGGGFCGADSGLVPVTSSSPMLRVSEMKVGEENGLE